MTPGAPARILAVRAGRGGDLVMLTPALRLLLDAFPEAELDLWTSADLREATTAAFADRPSSVEVL